MLVRLMNFEILNSVYILNYFKHLTLIHPLNLIRYFVEYDLKSWLSLIAIYLVAFMFKKDDNYYFIIKIIFL